MINALEYEQTMVLFSGELYRIALGSTHNSFDAEDIVQEVFVKLWKIHEKCRFESQEHLKYWLIRVTVNCINDHWRSVLRFPVIPLEEIDEPAVSYEYQDETDILSDLKPNDIRVLRLFYYEQFSSSEIASLLGISEAAVRQRLSRSRSRIKKSLLQQ